MSDVPEETRQRIVNYLAGTQGTSSQAVEALELEDKVGEDAIEDLMVDAGYERCEECDVWVEMGDLVDEAGEAQSCTGCRGPDHE